MYLPGADAIYVRPVELRRPRSPWLPEPEPLTGRRRWFALALLVQGVVALGGGVGCFVWAASGGRSDVDVAVASVLGGGALLLGAVLLGSALLLRRGSPSGVPVGAVAQLGAVLAVAGIVVALLA